MACIAQKCLNVNEERPIPCGICGLITILTLFMFGACHSVKRVTRKQNKFLLNSRIDTLKINAYELNIRDSSIIPCLDVLITGTEKLSEYDERIEPLFWVNFMVLKDSIFVGFESNNFYTSLDPELLFGEKSLKFSSEMHYEIIKYKHYNFIVFVNDLSNSKLNKAKESYFERNGEFTHFTTYRFTSIVDGKYIENWSLWINEIEYSYVNRQLHYVRRIYHPINRPFMVH